MANETTNFNIGGIDHPVKDPNAYVKPSTGIPKSDLSQEVQDALDESGSGDGTVTGVKVGSTTYEPTDGVVDLSTPFGGKVDKNGTDSLMTAAEHTKLQNLPTGDQLTQQLGTKANDADVVKSISVNGGQAQTPTNGNVNIVVEGAQGKSAYQSYYDTTSDNPKMTEAQWAAAILRSAYRSYLATTSDDPVMTEAQWVASLKGAKGDQGDTVLISETPQEFAGMIVNDLTTGGGGAALSAEMGKRLKSKIEEVYQRVQSIYSLLGNIAFWDGKPAAATILPSLDWGNPKHTVTLDLTLTNAVVTHNGEPVGDTILVEEFSTLMLIVSGAPNYALTDAPTVSFGSDTITPTDNGDGTYTIEVTMPQTDVTLEIEAEGTAAYSISYTLSGCDATTRPTSIVSGGTATIVLAANEGHIMPASLPSGAVTGASVVSYTPSQDGSSATLVICSVTGNVAIVITAGVSYAGTSVSVKKITAWPVLNSSFAPTPSDWSMTIVDDNTINCTVSANGKINIPSGYGLFSAVLTMDGVDISECIAFDTLTINVPNVTGTLALAVVVAEAVDGMFIGKSFHGSEGTTRTNPGCLVQGGVPAAPTSATANDDWCCMSEFAAIPSTANKFKIVYGNIFKNNENNVTTQPHNKRGVYVLLNAKGKYTCHYAIYSGGTTERILDWPVAQMIDGDAVYVRASFIKNKLADSALYYSTDGGNTWVQIFDGSEKNINS